MVSLFTNALEQVGQFHKTDDDLIDRLNHRFTVVLLVTFTAFVSAKQFIGDPISCWSPAHFSSSQIAYTNSICWLKGTYYLENDRRVIPHRTQNSEFRIAYYQFIPYMLLVMAMLFYFPHMLWRHISRHLGFDLRLIIQDIKKLLKTDNNVQEIALQIHRTLEYNSSKYTDNHHKFLNYFSKIRCSLSLLYIFIKVLYLINCLCQFYILTTFLSFPFHTFGIDWLVITLKKVHNQTNKQVYESKWFPRVVMCEFMVRQLGSNQHYMAIQCNLPINLFNELVFLIIWAWFIFLTCLTILSLILCLISVYTKFGHKFLHKYLDMSSLKLNKKEEYKFIEKYLRYDGILVLRILSQNTNDIIMSNLIDALYRIYSINHHHSDDQTESSGHYIPIDSSPI